MSIDISKIRHKDFLRSCVTLRGPPLYSETGWTGELWWNPVLLIFFFVIVTNVTTKCYHGYYRIPKMGQNSIKSPFFARRAKKASVEGRSPPQELEVGPRSGPYLLVYSKNGIVRQLFDFQKQTVKKTEGRFLTLKKNRKRNR